ncbi:glycosyltransferase family 2 protein [Candidatus Roizmanbacteria bacterium]|nr:glycosyltransferase family 2 protein [Candidatus Roizmanbacteria bacterium]
MKKAAIIIPTYNEAGNIEKLILSIKDVIADIAQWNISVVVVDSTSKDKTAEIVQELAKKYKFVHLLSTKKEGLGKAYVHGFAYAIERLSPQVIFEMDADLSHDPKEIPHFLKKIENGADFVIGSRYTKGGSTAQDWGIHRKISSMMGNLVLRFGFMKLGIKDWTDGYRAIKTWIIQDSMSHIQNYSGYVFQIALLDSALKRHATITEIPVHFKERTYGSSKINAFEYIAQILFYILWHSSFIKFVVVGGCGFILDFAISFILIEKAHWDAWKATLISTESAIISNFIFNNFWSFAHKKVSGLGSYLKNFIKFNLVSSGSILIQTLGVAFFDHIFGTQYWYLYKVFIIFFIVIPYSYILYNKLIWKDK